MAAGGDIAVSDPPPDADGWKIAIAPLEDAGRQEGPYLLLHDAAVSTSGDAEQYVEIDGKRYSHIVDPKTGLGLVGRMSATVVAPHGHHRRQPDEGRGACWGRRRASRSWRRTTASAAASCV